jgi:hypothetical protein
MLIGPLVRLKTDTSKVATRASPHPDGMVTVSDVDVAAETGSGTPSRTTILDAVFEAKLLPEMVAS